MLKRIVLKNFRKHRNSIIDLDPKLTVLVGENDTGKSSLIAAIQIVINNGQITKNDFGDLQEPLSIEIEMSDSAYGVRAEFSEGIVNSSKYTKLDARWVSGIKTTLEGKSDDEIKSIARSLGVKITSAMKITTIKEKISEKTSTRESYQSGFFLLDTAKEFPVASYSLSGVEFDSIEKFISEAFFKSKQKDIWNSQIDGITLSEFVQDQLDTYKVETEEEIEKSGIISIIKSYIDSVEKVDIQPTLDKRDINVTLSVRLLDSSGEGRSASVFGDGTKRRLTIALLQHKASMEESGALYLFDEPDTHLHVRAQNDLLNAFDSIIQSGNQVIVTTHSPFIMNAVDVKQVRLLSQYEKFVSIKGNLLDEEDRSDTLRELGIENIHLFFSRKFLIVEGETEEMFLKIAYRRMFGRPLSRDFIKLINMRGVNNVLPFKKMITEFVNGQDVFIISDRDAKEATRELIDSLPESNVYYIGHKEFEDSFSPEIIYQAWIHYLSKNGINPGPLWTSDELQLLYTDSQKREDGIGSHLSRLNSGCSTPLNKITMGLALATYCEEQHLPTELSTLLKVVHSSVNS